MGYLLASSFGAPTAGTYSHQRPLTLKGPAYYELDMALARTIPIPKIDGQSLQLRWEVFNLTNEAIFNGNPAGSTSGSTFGNYTTTGNPRIMQGSVKYIF